MAQVHGAGYTEAGAATLSAKLVMMSTSCTQSICEKCEQLQKALSAHTAVDLLPNLLPAPAGFVSLPGRGS